ncbi:MAG: histidine kinase dimerization/phosphoacceptor domain -containing protein [Pseudomonadota bacterium]
MTHDDVTIDGDIAATLAGGLPQFTVSVLQSTDDCIKVLELDGSLSHMSCRGRIAMEIDDFEAIRGAPWPSLWPEEERPILRQALEAARDGRVSEFEAACPTGKGTPKYWAVTVVPVLDRDGKVERICSTSRDITARKVLEQTRDAAAATAQARQDELTQLLAERDALIADMQHVIGERDHLIAEMDHRVKNSLALVGSMLRMQARGGENEETTVALQEASNRVMALARVHEGLQSRTLGDAVPVSDMVASLVRDLDTAIGANDPLVLDISAGLDLPGGHAAHLGLIFVELVQNARKHVGEATQPVEVSLTHDPATGDVLLSVADRGPGLPDGFDMRRDGGLGLRVCVSGAAQLNGSLDAANRTGGGACFNLRFPHPD